MLRNENILVRYAGKGSFVNNFTQVETSDEGKSPLIGVIMTDFNESFGLGLLNGIEQGVDGKANFLFRRSFGDLNKEQRYIQEFLAQGVDGFIIMPSHATHFSPAILQLVVDDYPLVLIDRYLKGLGVTAVSTDNEQATIEGMNYLFDLGHEYITLLSTSALYAVAVNDRISAFKKAYQQRGLSIDKASIVTDITATLPRSFLEGNAAKDIDIIKDHLSRNKNITAIFALEYNIALLAKRAINELGLRCPEDISIVCFDSPPYKLGSFKFTHILQRQRKIGITAVEELLKMLSSQNQKKIILVDARLEIGESTQAIK